MVRAFPRLVKRTAGTPSPWFIAGFRGRRLLKANVHQTIFPS